MNTAPPASDLASTLQKLTLAEVRRRLVALDAERAALMHLRREMCREELDRQREAREAGEVADAR
jgi:hypothetical protein